jgi:hypothetical protein
MIAHIRQPKKPDAASPLILARQMVAETLLPDGTVRPPRRAALRKVVRFGVLILLLAAAALAYRFWR